MHPLIAFALAVALPAADASPPYLNPRAFPELPKRVAAQLERMRCRIPQSAERTRPNNIITGQFMRPGQTTWAALCSIDRISRIVIVNARGGKVVDNLAALPDRTFTTDRSEFVRVILVAKPDRIRAADKLHGNRETLPVLDHDGIEDGLEGTGSGIHYFDRRRWLELAGSD